MGTKKNPGGSDLLLAGTAAAALYYFWPQISSMFGTSASVAPGAATPPLTDAQFAALKAQYDAAALKVPPVTSGATDPVSNVTSRMRIPAGALRPTVTVEPQTNAAPGFVGMYSMNPANQTIGPQSTLNGIRLRGGSAALIAQAAMAQVRTGAGPQVTNNSPIGDWTPGAERLPGGCYRYGNTPVLVNCPPGAAPPAPRRPARGRCAAGYTMDSAGICARMNDQVLLASLNSTPYSLGDAIQLGQLSPSIIGMYVSTTGVVPGTQLSAALGLQAHPANGVMQQGNDGFNYLPVQGTYIRQGTATQATRPTGPIGPRIKLQGLRAIAAALPITNAALIAASNDPEIAKLIGNDPRAMLTIAQWNYFYTQATGVAQGAPRYPEVDPHELISPQQYQNWRISAGLEVATPQKLGLIRNSRPGAFPLGGISDGPNRQPFIQPGNQNIYRIPGQGMRLGLIHNGGGNHRWASSPFPRPADWREAE